MTAFRKGPSTRLITGRKVCYLIDQGAFNSLISASNWPFSSLSFACALWNSVSSAASRLRKGSSS
jgi:hypothetical protein